MTRIYFHTTKYGVWTIRRVGLHWHADLDGQMTVVGDTLADTRRRLDARERTK